jgi:2-polyprenyl-6-methoxyphenol hydroxylase-like FAD-dependent oxidoreductase
MVRHADPEVLVVGAGPVGLVAALFLRQHGLNVEIVDMHQRTTQHSYALAIHPGTLRILEDAGLADALIHAGQKLTTVAYYEGPARRAEVDYSRLWSTHPYLLVVRQSLLERAADEALRPYLNRIAFRCAVPDNPDLLSPVEETTPGHG